MAAREFRADVASVAWMWVAAAYEDLRRAGLSRTPHQRRGEDSPAGSRNGWQPPATVKTTMGAVELQRPKLRGADEAFCSGETRRRVKVIGRLPGERSCLSLVWAVLDRASRGWRGVQQTIPSIRLLAERCSTPSPSTARR